MKIAIIGTVGVPARYGGFETLVENLLTYKSNFDISYQVYCSKRSYEEKPKTYKNAKLFYLPFRANGSQSPIYDIVSIIHALFTADKLLILGVSGCVILPFIRLFSKKQIITNIDGLEYKRQKWGKCARRFLKFSEKMAVRYSDIVIADNKVIQNYVWTEYGKSSELIEYGGDHALIEAENSVLSEFNIPAKTYAITICRIEPENNIHILLDAFSRMADKNLVVVGNWGRCNYGKNLRKKYAEYENIYMIDSIYDIKKLSALRQNALCCVHGHSAGGTNPSLVEAMNLGLPVVAFDVAYNRETTENKAIYFSNANALCQIVKNLNAETLKKNADEMKAISERRYKWAIVVKKYEDLMK